MRFTMAALAAGVLTLGSFGAMAQVRVHPPQVELQTPRPGFGYGTDPGVFSTRVHQRLGAIEQDLRAGVQTGRVEPQALRVMTMRRNQIEQQLSMASADGRIGRREERTIDDQVSRLGYLQRRFARRGAWGGGWRR